METCKTCGGSVKRIGNYYVCEYCRNKWEIDSGNDVHAVDRANAWSVLRDGDFEKATELFEDIILKENNNHEAYWGRALALGGIVYVTDLSENKKVPTCNNITEESFLNSKDVQKAISLAPADIAESYRKQADYIEKVRVEWLEKASKEPAYDVFISFKDSDRENGIERTQDSIDAQDLYNALVADGYQVFFSRISLRDKISEQYEPYIYNAIKTAKVMIVFGEKPEYFSAVWLKNEWMRFKSRIEKGEKHKNSLVVVYKNMNPADLPAVLRSRQCLNAADMTFLSDLTRHIKRVVKEAERNVHLEKIEIVGGQIAKKASSIAVNSVKTREIGAGAIGETSISEKQSVSLIKTYLEEKQWTDAQQLVDDVLFENPSCAEAIWCSLLLHNKVSSNKALAKSLDAMSDADYDIVEKYLNCTTKEAAEEVLILLYRSINDVTDDTFVKLLNVILPFSFKNRQKEINNAFQVSIQKSYYSSFKTLLGTLQPENVDCYIKYNYSFAKKAASALQKKECLENVLNVDEGNVDALRDIIDAYWDLEQNNDADHKVSDMLVRFEKLLQYTSNVDREVVTFIEKLSNQEIDTSNAIAVKQIIRYYTKDISDLKQQLIKFAYKLIENALFEQAEYFLKLVLSFDANNADAYWAICLIKMQATSEEELIEKDDFLTDIPEFNKYLTLVGEERRKECIRLKEATKVRIQREKYAFAQTLGSFKGFFLNIKTLHVFESGVMKNEDMLLSQFKIKKILCHHSADYQAIQTVDNKIFTYQKDSKQWIQQKYPDPANIAEIPFEGCLLYKNGEINFLTYAAKKKYLQEGWGVLNGRCYSGVCIDIDTKQAVQVIGCYKRVYVLKNNGIVEIYHEERGREVLDFRNVVQLFEGVSYILGLFADGAIRIIGDFGAPIALNPSIERRFITENEALKEDVVALWNLNQYLYFSNNVYCCLKRNGTVLRMEVDKSTGSVKTEVYEEKCFSNFDTLIDDYAASVSKYESQNTNDAFSNKESEAETNGESPTKTKSKGCYVATCVYGSYDCPQVWTLRRFRDNVLAKTWYGRGFIHTYYATSPTLVKWFGHMAWFKKLWKSKLDRMIQKLNAQGVENTPYND